MTNLVEPAFGRWETANMLYDLYSRGILKGNIYPTLRIAKTCCALCVSSYIIGPIGEIYKCWNDVSDESKIIGYIDRSDIVNKTLYYRYHQGCAWYNDPVCKNVSSCQFAMENVRGIMREICIITVNLISVNASKSTRFIR